MKSPLSLLCACLLLGACATPAEHPDSGISAPPAWQSPVSASTDEKRQQWWATFGSPELEGLIAQAQLGSHDLAAAVARVRQAQATAVIAAGPLLPQVQGGLNANRQKLLRGNGYSQLDADSSNQAVDYFDASLSASYEIDFWGARHAARDSALQGVRASEFDQATVELTLLSSVANRYSQSLSLAEQSRIAELNLGNAQSVLKLVQTRYDSGSATALELAQQKSLVAAQQRQLPLVQQQAAEAWISLAALLGRPVQALPRSHLTFAHMSWPSIASGVPSDLLSRRPDIARAEAQLAAAQADVTVARAAMLPSVTLSANIGSGADTVGPVAQSVLQPHGRAGGADLQQRPPERRTRPRHRAPARAAGELSRGNHQWLRRRRKSPHQHSRPRPAAPMANRGTGPGPDRLRHRPEPLPGRRRGSAQRAGNPTHSVCRPGLERATAPGAVAGQHWLIQSVGGQLVS